MPTTTTSFMGLLQDAEVDLGAPPLEPFRFGDDLEEEGDEEEEGEDEEEVTEIEEEAFAAVARPAIRSTNYSEDGDILLETIAGLRYKEMAASKGKAFSFKHAWAILQTFDN
ncbi:DNA mismatch repair protein Msh6-1 [Hordeum vulgare]|nr:DNA mismatch repair protein Msh6-1 [Hordeum vulgare]